MEFFANFFIRGLDIDYIFGHGPDSEKSQKRVVMRKMNYRPNDSLAKSSQEKSAFDQMNVGEILHRPNDVGQISFDQIKSSK